MDEVADIFDAAIALPPDQRLAHIDQACRANDRLAQRVRALLEAHDRADEVLLKPPSSSGSSLGHALDTEFPRDLAGTRIGHYTLKRRIAVGGMGVVYEAQQDNPRRSVALKVMKAGIATESVMRRFEFETHVLGRLQHPNIAHIHDAGVHDGEFGPVPYFAMELIDDAKTIIEYAADESLDTAARLQLFVRVCRAVHYGHLKGVIHRDLKPSNVLVDASGEPKIIDFGVARATDSDTSLTSGQTDAGKVIGTVQYMSPEQAGGRIDELDTRSDVYSLGVLLFELLSGSLPYALEERAIHEVVRIIQQDEPTTLGSVNGSLHGDIETIVAKAVEKDQSRRYQSADEFAADIRRYLNNDPIEARPPTTRYQLAKFMRRNRVGVAAIGVIALVLLGATGVSISFAVSEGGQRRIAEAQATRAEQERAIAEAVNEFLNKDLLAAVAPSSEPGKGRDVLMRDVLDEAATRIEEASRAGGRFEEMPLVEASIRATLGSTYRKLGEYGAAQPHVERAHLLRRRELGEEHQDTLKSMGLLAMLYNDQGRYEEAEPLYLKTVEIQERVLGEEHRDTLRSMNNLAVLYMRQGRFSDAESIYVKGLEIQKRVLGEESTETLRFEGNLGVVYWNQGRYDKAEPLYVKMLESCTRIHGEEHPNTLRALNNLATLFGVQGRYDEAEPLYLKTLEIQKRVMGEEHPITLYCMNNLALVYRNQGRYDEAEPLCVKTLEIQKRVLGEEHPDTLDSVGNLALLYSAQGRYNEAEPLRVKTLEIQRRVLGEEHPDTLGSMNELAILYKSLERMDDARPLVRELQEIGRRIADRSGASASDKNKIAWDMLTCEPDDLRDPEAALRLAREACAMTNNANPDFLNTLALAQHLTGDTPAAIETEKTAMSLLSPDAPEHDDFLTALAKYEAGGSEGDDKAPQEDEP